MMNTFSQLVLALQLKDPLAFSRFGVSEFNCIFRCLGSNIDGHPYTDDLGQRLRGILLSRPPYNISVTPEAQTLYSPGNPHCGEFCRMTEGIANGNNAHIFRSACLSGAIGSLFALLRERRVYVVGPAYLKFVKHFPFELIPISVSCCWKQYTDTLTECLRVRGEGVVFLFCASMMSKVLIHDMWCNYPQGTYLDIGSVMDPYAGRFTRKYHFHVVPPKFPEA